MKWRFIIYLFFQLLLASVCTAQDEYRLANTYKTDDGLPQNSVSAIMKDANGYYWFNTDGGVARWDGRKFIKTEHAALQSGSSYFKEDLVGNEYILHNDKMYIIDSISQAKQIDNRKINVLVTRFGEIFFLKHNTETLLRNAGPKLADLFTEMTLPTSGTYCLSDSKESFYLFDAGTGLYVKNDSVHLLMESKEYGTALLIKNKLIYLKPDGTYKVYDNGELIYNGEYKFQEDDKKYPFGFWNVQNNGETSFFAYNNKIYKAAYSDTGRLTITKYLTIQDPSLFQTFYCDEQNKIVVFGGYNNGISVYTKPLLVQTALNKETEKNIIYSQIDFDKRIITDRDIFDNFNGANAKRWSYGYAGSFLRIDQQHFLFGDQIVLYLFDDKLRVKQQWPVSNSVRNFVRMGNDIYFADDAIRKLDLSTYHLFTIGLKGTDDGDSLVKYVSASFQQNQLLIAIGSDLYKLNLEDTSLTKVRGFHFAQWNRVEIYPDKEDQFFFVVERTVGIKILLKNSSSITLPLDENKALLNCNSIIEDKDGDIWLTTNNGILLLKRSALESYIHGNQKTLFYKKFGVGEGLKNEEFNGGFEGSAIFAGDTISIASMGGLVKFDPNIKNEPFHEKGKPLATNILIDGIKQTVTNHYNISPYFKQFELEVSYPFIEKKKAKLIYRIQGSNDTSWLDIAANGSLILRNMPPGHYILEIKPEAGNKDNELSIAFHVKQFWYESPLAILGYILLLIALFLLLYYNNLQKFKRRLKIEQLINEEKLRVLRSQINPHFLQNTFSFLSYSLNENNSNKNIAGFLHHLSGYYRKVLSNTDKLMVNLEEELEILNEYLEIQKEIYPIHFDYDIHPEDDVDVFGVEIPFLLLQPIVENVLKHAFISKPEQPQIKIVIYNNDANFVVCEIRDNGGGYPANQSGDKSFGNKIIEQRLDLSYKSYHYKPEFNIHSVINEGTTVMVKIPTN